MNDDPPMVKFQRDLHPCFFCAFLTIGFAFSVLPTVQAESSRPNVLFLVADDLRLNLGCYGDELAVTPNLDQLAARSVRFDRAYCQFASCNASRASVLTGQRPDSISVYKLNTDYRKTAPNAITLPQHFRENGYHTEAIGKVLHNYGQSHDNDRAWSVPARLDKLSHFLDYALPENSEQKATVAEEAPLRGEVDPYLDAEITADAVATIQRLATTDEPFFLAVGFMKPHSPYNAPQKYWDLYDREKIRPLSSEERAPGIVDLNWPNAAEIRGFLDVPRKGPIPSETAAKMRHGYYAATSYLDENIGKVLETLKEAGIAENTIVVFWSDHGYHLGENDHWAKVTVRELDAHVPLLVHVPGVAAGVRQGLVEYIDLFPTLAELSGLPEPAGIDGRSFVPILNEQVERFRTAALTQTSRPWGGKGPIQQMGYSIRTDEHRYTRWIQMDSGEVIAEEIYDLISDPFQRKNEIENDELEAVLLVHRRFLEEEIADDL